MQITQVLREGAFELEVRKDGMVNGTTMANHHGKQISDFLRLETTKSFVTVLESTARGIPRIETKGGEFTPGKGKSPQIVWLHRKLAYKLASWLDPYFENAVYDILDQYFHGNLIEPESRVTGKKRLARKKPVFSAAASVLTAPSIQHEPLRNLFTAMKPEHWYRFGELADELGERPCFPNPEKLPRGPSFNATSGRILAQNVGKTFSIENRRVTFQAKGKSRHRRYRTHWLR